MDAFHVLIAPHVFVNDTQGLERVVDVAYRLPPATEELREEVLVGKLECLYERGRGKIMNDCVECFGGGRDDDCAGVEKRVRTGATFFNFGWMDFAGKGAVLGGPVREVSEDLRRSGLGHLLPTVSHNKSDSCGALLLTSLLDNARIFAGCMRTHAQLRSSLSQAQYQTARPCFSELSCPSLSAQLARIIITLYSLRKNLLWMHVPRIE